MLDVKALARQHPVFAIEQLVKIAKMTGEKTASARVAACNSILDRGWGKPGQHHQHEGDSRQYVISGEPLSIDEWREKYCRP